MNFIYKCPSLLFVVLILLLDYNVSNAQNPNLEILASYPSIRLNNLTELLADDDVTPSDLQHESNATGITFSNDASLLDSIRVQVRKLDSLYQYTSYDLGLYLNARVMKEEGEEIIQNVYDALSVIHNTVPNINPNFILNIFYVTNKPGVLEYQMRAKFGNGVAEDAMTESDKKTILLDCQDKGNFHKRNNILINAHYNAQALIVSQFIFYLNGYENDLFMEDFTFTSGANGGENNSSSVVTNQYRVYISPAGLPIKLPPGTKVVFFDKPTDPILMLAFQHMEGALEAFTLPDHYETRYYSAKGRAIDGDFRGYGPKGMMVGEQTWYRNPDPQYDKTNSFSAWLGYKHQDGNCSFDVTRKSLFNFKSTYNEEQDTFSHARARGPVGFYSNIGMSLSAPWHQGFLNYEAGPIQIHLLQVHPPVSRTPKQCMTDITQDQLENAPAFYAKDILANGDTLHNLYLKVNGFWVFQGLDDDQNTVGSIYYKWDDLKQRWVEFFPVEEKTFIDDFNSFFTDFLFTSEAGHLLLDALGTVPIIGEGFDALNGVWFYIEGKYVDAAFSLGAVIPFAGMAVTGGKIGFKTAKITDTAEKGVRGLALVKNGKVTKVIKKQDIDAITNKLEDLYKINGELNVPEGVINLIKKDIQDTPELLGLFKDKPSSIEAWDMIRKGAGSQGDEFIDTIRKNIDDVEKLADDLTANPGLKNFIEGGNKNANISTWKFCKDEGLPFCN